MKIEHARKGNMLALKLIGALDYDSANELKTFLGENYEGTNRMIMDLSQMDYTSSAGMRVILEAELIMKKRDGLILVHANEEVMKAFKISGFDRFLHIEP